MDERDPWARGIAQDVLNRKHTEELARRSQTSEWEQKRAHAPRLWEELKTEMQTAIDAINTYIGQGEVLTYTLENANKFSVALMRRIQRVDFEYKPDACWLQILQINTSSEFQVGIVNGEVMWSSKQLGLRTSVQVAKYILSDTARFI